MIRVGRNDPLDEFRGFRVSFDDGRFAVGSFKEGELLAVEAKRVLFGFKSVLVGAVTAIAILGENGLNEKEDGKKAFHRLG